MFKLTRAEQLIIAVIFLSVLGFGVTQHVISQSKTAKNSIEIQSNISAPEPVSIPERTVTVHVSGAVVSAGVYCLPRNSCVEDAVVRAGLTAAADVSKLNLKARLVDGQQIMVAGTGQKQLAYAGHGAARMININTASASQLQELPGIGKVYAARIIEYRSQSRFRNIQEITRVKGIGPKTFATIKDMICVR